MAGNRQGEGYSRPLGRLASLLRACQRLTPDRPIYRAAGVRSVCTTVASALNGPMATQSSIQLTSPAYRARRRDDLHVEELDAEAVVHHSRNGAVHRLDAITFFIWSSCDGTRTLEELAGDVARHFSAAQAEAASVVESAVESAVAQLRDKQLLEGDTATSGVFTGPIDRGFSRREMLRGGFGRAMLAAPIISTFFAVGAYASGPSASGAFGPGGCKESQYSCFVDTDCCQAPATRLCESGSCCVKLNQVCNSNADCCANAGSGCDGGICRP